jgi:septum formation topological specificity factor MinE
MGLIGNGKVPTDVGRPRLRLLLGDERLNDADSDELATVVQSLLSVKFCFSQELII